MFEFLGSALQGAWDLFRLFLFLPILIPLVFAKKK